MYCRFIFSMVVPLLTLSSHAQSNPLPLSEKLSPEKVAAISMKVETTYPQLSAELRSDILNTVVRSLDNMVFVEGGEFEMGDFGAPCDFDQANMGVWPYGYEPDELCPITGETHDDYLHKVRLSGYHLSRYQTSLRDFDLFRTSQGLPLFDEEYRNRADLQDMFRGDNPAPPKSWQEAKNYCLWLGELSLYPIDLPSEAQWEYAARNRGQYVQYPTNTGNLDGGKNIAQDEETSVLPIGQFLPSPLGLYDVTGNATDWVDDWYDPDYYRYAPVDNPPGAASGTLKIRRGSTISELNWQSANTVRRWADKPIHNGYILGSSFRCAIHIEHPL